MGAGREIRLHAVLYGNQDLVGRIAILSTPRWHDERDRLSDLYQKAEVKYFTPAESDSAIVWLTGA
jgi:hypothetical protein